MLIKKFFCVLCFSICINSLYSQSDNYLIINAIEDSVVLIKKHDAVNINLLISNLSDKKITLLFFNKLVDPSFIVTNNKEYIEYCWHPIGLSFFIENDNNDYLFAQKMYISYKNYKDEAESLCKVNYLNKKMQIRRKLLSYSDFYEHIMAKFTINEYIDALKIPIHLNIRQYFRYLKPGIYYITIYYSYKGNSNEVIRSYNLLPINNVTNEYIFNGCISIKRIKILIE